MDLLIDEENIAEAFSNVNSAINCFNSWKKEMDYDLVSLLANLGTNLEELYYKLSVLYLSLDLKSDKFNGSYAEFLNSNISMEKKLFLLTVLNPNVNNSGIFSKMTDYQKVMLAELSFITLFYSPDEVDSEYVERWGNPITIKDLFVLTNDGQYSVDDYLSFSLSTEDITLPLEERKKKYNLFLGSLVLMGYGDYKVESICKNPDTGFDAIALSDNNDEALVYFPGTDFNDANDVNYDIGGFLAVSLSNGVLDNEAWEYLREKKFAPVVMYEAQQKEALSFAKLYNRYFNKLHIGGYSLGGSLGEHVYFSKTCNNLGDMYLFNPYHTEIDVDIFNKYKDSIHIFASEYDIVSKALNFNGVDVYHNNTIFIPIDSNSIETQIKEAFSNANSSDNYIMPIINKALNTSWSTNNPDSVNVIKDLVSVFPPVENAIKQSLNVDVSAIPSTQDLEVAFSVFHQVYPVSSSVNYSFENGMVKMETQNYDANAIINLIHDMH